MTLDIKSEGQKSANNGTVASAPDCACAGCGKKITDRFFLKACELFWHEDCLKCGCCDCRWQFNELINWTRFKGINRFNFSRGLFQAGRSRIHSVHKGESHTLQARLPEVVRKHGLLFRVQQSHTSFRNGHESQTQRLPFRMFCMPAMQS